jgi:hypothetical protein
LCFGLDKGLGRVIFDLLATQLTETKGVEQVFELDTAHRIRVIQGQLFAAGQFKKIMNSSEIAYLYSKLEELALELSEQYSDKERTARERQLRQELKR